MATEMVAETTAVAVPWVMEKVVAGLMMVAAMGGLSARVAFVMEEASEVVSAPVPLRQQELRFVMEEASEVASAPVPLRQQELRARGPPSQLVR